MDAGSIQESANRQQFINQTQSQNSFRPNVNPNLTGARPPPPQVQQTGFPQQQQQQRPLAPPPLRKIDSKQNLPLQPPGSQQRPVGPIPNQQFRPSVLPPGVQGTQQHQLRPQPPPNWQGNPVGPGIPNQQQQNRPPHPPYGNQPQNPQLRPPFQRPPGQQPVTAPGQPPFRPPIQQQQQQQQYQQQQQHQLLQRTNSANLKPLPNQQNIVQNPKMSSEVAKPHANNSLLNSNDDDDDVVIGRSSTPLKTMKPVDPMTQSQYGFFDSSTRSGMQGDENKKEPYKNLTSFEEDVKSKNSEYRNIQNRDISNESALKNSDFDQSAVRQNIQKSGNLSGSETHSKQMEDFYKHNEMRNVPSTPSKKPSAAPQPNDRTEVNQRVIAKNLINQSKNDSNKKPDIYYLDPKQKLHNKMLKGDNDSGVDESTQGNERNGPGSPGSPLKSPTKMSANSRPPSATPSSKSNKSRSTSRSRLLKTPEPEPIKKVPMNKIQVGNAPSPNLKAVKSKIGSLENTAYKPGGGNIKIESKKIEIKATPRIEAKNDKYMPKGGDKKIISTKLQWNAKSKIGSLENAHHKPGGGDKKIETIKTDFKDKAKPKVGSKENVKHVPKGGDIKIQTQKLEIKAQSKIGSLDNVMHKPGGGDKRIFDDKEYLKNVEHPVAPTPPSQSPIPPAMTTSSGADENLNKQQS